VPPSEGIVAAESTEEQEQQQEVAPLTPLEMTQAELSALREQTELSQEALRATNEELQSANEELQSTNEELTTSKEEMQSLNEELQTVNAELQAKIQEMAAVTGDMENLLNSTEAATVFLDEELNIRRFTPAAKLLFKLRPVDLGRPLSDITSDLDYPHLLTDARIVLRTLTSIDKTATASGRRCFNVRIMPYRNVQNIIDGIVLTFTEVSEAYAQQMTLAEIERLLNNVSGSSDAVAVLREVKRIVSQHLPQGKGKGHGHEDGQPARRPEPNTKVTTP
jgi:myosin heavy subunit